MLKESDDLDLGILGATFDSKRTFEKHLGRLVSRVASQRLGILIEEVLREYTMIGCFRGLSCPLGVQYSAVLHDVRLQ